MSEKDDLPVPRPEAKFLPPEKQDFETDIEYVRKNQYALIEKSIDGLQGIIDVAEQSQHPRAYEVLSTYLKTVSELNKDLLATAEKKKAANVQEASPLSTTTNNLFVGSTADIANMLKNMNDRRED